MGVCLSENPLYQASTWKGEDDGGSAEEPQKDYRTREGNLRQCDEEALYHGITIILTTTPKAHDGPLNYRNNNMATVPAATRRLMAPNASKTECLLFMLLTPLMTSLGAPSFCRSDHSSQKQGTDQYQEDRRQ